MLPLDPPSAGKQIAAACGVRISTVWLSPDALDGRLFAPTGPHAAHHFCVAGGVSAAPQRRVSVATVGVGLGCLDNRCPLADFGAQQRFGASGEIWRSGGHDFGARSFILARNAGSLMARRRHGLPTSAGVFFGA